MPAPFSIPRLVDEPDMRSITPMDFERYKRIRDAKLRSMFPTEEQVIAAWAEWDRNLFAEDFPKDPA